MNCHRTVKSGCENIIYHSKSSFGSHDFPYQTLENFPRIGYDQLDDLNESMTHIWLGNVNTNGL